MSSFSFRAYRLDDAAEVVALWNNTALKASFPLSERLWRQQTEGDPDFEPQDVTLVYAEDGALAGFVLTKSWRGKAITPELAPYFEPLKTRGFIAALAVGEAYQRQGLGRALVQKAEAQLQGAGATQIWPGANIRHFFPGVPVELPEVETFFHKLGYQTGSPDETDLRRSDLDKWTPPPTPQAVTQGDYSFGQGQEGEQAAILAFMRRAFPGRWFYEAELFFRQGGSPKDITLLKHRNGTIEGFLMNYHRDSTVIGPTIYWSTLLDPSFGGIGPLGVSKEVRGLGLGLFLVAAGVEYLLSKGVTDCVIDWTTLVDFYGKLGFLPWKQYKRMHKEPG